MSNMDMVVPISRSMTASSRLSSVRIWRPGNAARLGRSPSRTCRRAGRSWPGRSFGRSPAAHLQDSHGRVAEDLEQAPFVIDGCNDPVRADRTTEVGADRASFAVGQVADVTFIQVLDQFLVGRVHAWPPLSKFRRCRRMIGYSGCDAGLRQADFSAGLPRTRPRRAARKVRIVAPIPISLFRHPARN